MTSKMRTAFPKTKIKQIMQLDDDVGKIAADVPIMISRAVELFLKELLQNAAKVASDRSNGIIQAGHLKRSIVNSIVFDFLKHLVEHVPDLLDKQELAPRAPKNRKNELDQPVKKKKSKLETVSIPAKVDSFAVKGGCSQGSAKINYAEAKTRNVVAVEVISGDDVEDDDDWDNND
uniref:Transcription factor CBF/NF-Y/archaeal histone domain-containing protein n=1 Tax=Spongospora subterranea TaxID=70186 RepID=A0A0H5QZN2_9EUKA|eukprot:CRZ07433.1 hypothetical protein [Spongospora subterranea]